MCESSKEVYQLKMLYSLLIVIFFKNKIALVR